MIRSEAGFLTLDFLFAIMIAFGMTIVVFSLTFTLAVVEVAQYIAYSTSRTHMAGDVDKETQKQNALTQYNNLLKSKAFAPLFTNFFELSKEPDIRPGGDNTFAGADYPSKAVGAERLFSGVRLKFTSKVLDFQLPLLGSVTPDDGFTANVTAFLLREPTQQECIQFMEKRLEFLKKSDSRFSISSFDVQETPWEDNGC